MIKIKQILALVAGLMLPLAGLQAQDYSVPDNTPAHIKRAVESDARGDDQKARDAGRKPAEVLTLADLNEGDHVESINVRWADGLTQTLSIDEASDRIVIEKETAAE